MGAEGVLSAHGRSVSVDGALPYDVAAIRRSLAWSGAARTRRGSDRVAEVLSLAAERNVRQ